jgi:hypothetical protein
VTRARSTSFVVRAIQDRHGQLSGVIERVAMGAKEAFTGMDAVGRVIVGMLERECACGGRPAEGEARRGEPGATP